MAVDDNPKQFYQRAFRVLSHVALPEKFRGLTPRPFPLRVKTPLRRYVTQTPTQEEVSPPSVF